MRAGLPALRNPWIFFRSPIDFQQYRIAPPSDQPDANVRPVRAEGYAVNLAPALVLKTGPFLFGGDLPQFDPAVLNPRSEYLAIRAECDRVHNLRVPPENGTVLPLLDVPDP